MNFADEALDAGYPEERYVPNNGARRYIEEAPQPARYTIETSDDGAHWTVLETVEREGANAYFEFADGIAARRVRVVGQAMP